MPVPPVIPSDARLTVREKIIAYLMTQVAAMRQYGEDEEDIGPLFKNVRRGDPDDDPNYTKVINAPMCYVEDGEEVSQGAQMLYTQEVISKALTVYVHVRFEKGQRGVDPFKVFNYYLGRLQQTILTDYRLGNNAIDVNESASSPQIFNGDNLQGGFLVLTVIYRHVRNNPYEQR